MARKKPAVDKVTVTVNASVADLKGIAALVPKVDDLRSVREVTLEGSRRLVTIEAEDKLWDSKRRSAVSGIEGAIVRLRPPATAADDDVERLRATFQKAGAERVTVLPRPRAEVVPAEAHERSKEKAFGAREAVTSLVAESNSKDKAGLAALCERVMAEVGL